MITIQPNGKSLGQSRRGFVKGMLLFAAMAALPLRSFARAVGAFKASDVNVIIKELFGELPIVESNDITFKIPDIAENGAVVPVTVSTEIPGVEQISIVVDNNPSPLSAVFDLGPGSLPEVSSRIKVGNSSMARAFVKTKDKVFTTSKEVKVTIGGCGG